MRIALTGASGFLGRKFVAKALAAGHQIRSLTRAGGDDGRVQMIQGSLENAAAVNELVRGADVLVHLAAAGVSSDQREWDTAMSVNVVGTAALIRAAALEGVRHSVVAGTCLEYRGYGRLPDQPWVGSPVLCKEESPLEPVGCYCSSKAAGGILARSIARETSHSLWYLRFATMYGPGDNSNKVLPAALAAAVTRTEFATTPGEQIRDWLWVEDAARALLRACEFRPPSTVEICNVGTGVGHALRDVLGLMYQVAGADHRTLRTGSRSYRFGEPHVLVLDPSRFGVLLDSSPMVGLEEGLQQWVRRSRELAQ